MEDKKGSALEVERHGMEPIPENERHGKVASQFTLWFSSNVQINSFVTGTLAVVLGLNLFWAIAAIVVGNAVGSLFHISTWIGVILWNIVILVVAIYGYDLVHASGRVATVISAILFLVLFIHLLGDTPAHYKGTAQSFATFMLVISVMAGWQITWAPYVSDYSRYLPVETPARKTFLYTYGGLVGGAICVQIIGALAATTGAAELSNNVSAFVAHQFNGIYGIILLAILIGNIPATVESPYGGFLTFWAMVSPTGKGVPPRQARTLFAIVFTIIGSVLSIAASSSLLTTANDVIVFLLYVLIPWTAMNLVDYYFVRRGHYDVKELFNLDGIYGRFNWWALGIYIVVMAIEVPFMNTSVFTGPIAKSLNGADLTWIVGLILASVSYYVIAKRVLPRSELPEEMAEPV